MNEAIFFNNSMTVDDYEENLKKIDNDYCFYNAAIGLGLSELMGNGLITGTKKFLDRCNERKLDLENSDDKNLKGQIAAQNTADFCKTVIKTALSIGLSILAASKLTETLRTEDEQALWQ